MAYGQPGLPGVLALLLVVLATRQGQGHVNTHPILLEERTVWVPQRNHRTVMLGRVQVSEFL